MPEHIPYWAGETYKPLFTSFVPRIIYPNKLEERVGNEFGHRYKLLHQQNTSSVNLPWITELHANFGVWGVLIGMGLIGIFLALMDRIFNSRRISDAEFAVGIGILLPLVIPESNFLVKVGSILPLTISLYIYFRGGSWLLENCRSKI